MRERSRLFLPTALLFALSFAVYVPSLSGDFLLDDSANIVMNPYLSRPSRWGRFLYDRDSQTRDPRLARQIYRPLTTLSFAVSDYLAGPNPFWQHLLSVLLHAGNVCLMFFLALRLFGNFRGAVVSALVFCLHPAQVEGVAYISGSRPTEMCLFFSLLALLLYMPKTSSGMGSDRPALRRALSVICFVLATLSKEGSIFLLPVLASYDLTFSPDESWGKRARRWAPYGVLFAAFFAVRRQVLGQWAQGPPWGNTLAAHVEFAARGLFKDFTIAFWPAKLKGCYNLLSAHDVPSACAGLLIAAGLCAAALYASRRRRLEGLGLVWFLAALVPVSNIVPIDGLAADRFLYIPLAGLALIAGYWFSLIKNPRPPLSAACVALAVLATLRDADLQGAWQAPFLLALDEYHVEPRDVCSALQLSVDYSNWRMLDRVDVLTAPFVGENTSEVIRPGVMTLRAAARVKANRCAEAVPMLEDALKLDPDEQDARMLLSVCRARSKKPPAKRFRRY